MVLKGGSDVKQTCKESGNMNEEEQRVKPGVVNIDGIYGFKVDTDCYPFGRFKNGELVPSLYPTSIEGIFRLYFKAKLTDITAGKKLEIEHLLIAVEEVKKIISDIQGILEL